MSAASLNLTAPAKINLSLRIFGKREDGYHDLETLMAPIALSDEIEIGHAHAVPPRTITLFCNDPTLPTDADNLCVKAAEAFYNATGIEASVTITLHKKIPHGAGLGGGSSDAAAILGGMNSLFKEPLAFQELHQIATSLGSDVPFFLDPKPRYCRGRGELLGETVSLPDWKLLLIKPRFGISAAEAYHRLEGKGYRLQDDAKKEVSPTIHNFVYKLTGNDPVLIFNDLEGPVFEKYLQLPILKSWLQGRPELTTAWMTGSGSTMVAALPKETPSTAITILKKDIAAELGQTIWIAETSFI